MGKPSKGGSNSNTISGNKRDNVLNGSDAAETIDGKGGDDTLFGGGGNDTIYGGSGTDLAIFSYGRDSYEVTDLGNGQILVSGPDGDDLISGVELFQFADMTQTLNEVVLPRLANLTADGISVDDAILSPGETSGITVQVSSNGVVDAGASTAELLIATAPDEAAVTGSLGTVDLAALATGTGETASFTLDPGALEPGTYWVAVRVDSGDAVTEENETDNLTEWVQITVEAPVADLKLASATVGAGSDLNLEGGGRIDMTYAIENASNIDVSYFSVATYISTDTTISADDHRIAGATGGTFPGHTNNFTVSHWLPESYAAGDYYLISVVNWGDGTPDATPGDNVITQTITLTPPPPPTVDVAVTGVEISASSDLDLGPDGGRLDLSIDLANGGTGAASGVGLTAYLSTDGTVSEDDIAIWSGITSLAAGDTATMTATAQVDLNIPAGDYQVIVVADAADDIDAANDSASAGVTLIGGIGTGTAGDDVWVSGPGSDVVDLMGGDDIAHAGAGSDSVDGGAGFDTLDFSGWSEGVGVFFDSYIGSELYAYPTAGGAPVSSWNNFEHLVLTGHDDQVALYDGSPMSVDAGDGNDTVEGSFGDDVIDAGAGDDLITGLFGNDVLRTGEGFDFVGIARDTSTGTVTGFGHDVVEDFDTDFDLILIQTADGETYDPLADLIQSPDGALLIYADDSSLLLNGVDSADLTMEHFQFMDPAGPVPTM